MKIQRKDLLRHLESCAPGLSTSGNLEQAECFIFSDGYVHTFNDEMYCKQETVLSMRCAVPAKPLLETLRKLTEDEIDVVHDIDKGVLTIKCANVRKITLNIHADAVNHHASVPQPENWQDVPPVFADALAMTADSAAKESEEFVLSCVHISPHGLQATDTFQAIRYRLECPVSKPTLIRRSACASVNGLGVAAICEVEGWLYLKTYTGLQVAVRTYDEEFPDLSEAFKQESRASLRFPPCLLDALAKASIFLADTGSGKQAQIRLKPNKVMIRGQNESGTYEEIRDIEYDGPSRSFGLNPKYVQTLLKHDYPISLTDNAMRVRGESFSYITCTENIV
jgi:DNA polymerase III sliding clamp (beta) subunit (PCNA family)